MNPSLCTHLSYIWPGLWHRLIGWHRTGEKVPSASGLQPKTWNNLSLFLLSVPAFAQLWDFAIFLALIYFLSTYGDRMVIYAFCKSLSCWLTKDVHLFYTFVLRKTLNVIKHAMTILYVGMPWKWSDWIGPAFQANHKVKKLFKHCYLLPSYLFLSGMPPAAWYLVEWKDKAAKCATVIAR